MGIEGYVLYGAIVFMMVYCEVFVGGVEALKQQEAG